MQKVKFVKQNKLYKIRYWGISYYRYCHWGNSNEFDNLQVS
jgi:hypothetical protein